MPKMIREYTEVDAEILRNEIEEAKRQLVLSYKIHRSFENTEVQSHNERIDNLLSQYYRLYKEELLAESKSEPEKMVKLA